MSGKKSSLDELAELVRLTKAGGGTTVRKGRRIEERNRVKRQHLVMNLEGLVESLREESGGPTVLRMLEAGGVNMGKSLTEALRRDDGKTATVVDQLVKTLREQLAATIEKAVDGLSERT